MVVNRAKPWVMMVEKIRCHVVREIAGGIMLGGTGKRYARDGHTVS